MRSQKQHKRDCAKPKREFDSSYCELIIQLAAEGRWATHFCRELRCGKQVFYRFQQEYPEFAEAVEIAQPMYEAWWEDQGREGMRLSNRQFNAAVWIYTMKVRFAHWQERSHVETVDKTPKATFVAPEQYSSLEQWSSAYQEESSKDGS